MKGILLMIVVVGLSAGCNKQKYGQCDPPQDELEVLFKAKSQTNPFSHSFCVVCNTEIEPSEYSDWAVSMGANPLEDEYIDTVHPCLYVYPNDSTPESGIDSLEKCESAVCDGEATYADMVGKGQGNFDVIPLLEGDILVNEEWIFQKTQLPETQSPHHQDLAHTPQAADSLQR